MKILEIFTEKLRYKNYSPRTINVYKSYLNNFLKFNNIKDILHLKQPKYTPMHPINC
jgi:hypothetical protein